MVVYDVGEVICRHTVRLYQYHIVKLGTIHAYVAVYGVVKAGLALLRHVLAYNIRFARGKPPVDLLLGKVQAVLVILKGFSPVGCGLPAAVQLLIGAEAVICLTHFNKPLGVRKIHILPFTLNIRPVFAAYVRTLVPIHAYAFERPVYHLGSALNIAVLVGILYAQYKPAAMMPCVEPCIKRAPEVAYMHIARGRRGKSGPDCFKRIRHLCILSEL